MDDDAVVLNTQQWPPYQTQDGDVQSGLAVDIVRCAFTGLERDVVFVFLPWRRAQSEARAGLADGFFAASQSAQRDQYATLSAPIAAQVWTWFISPEAKMAPDDPAFRLEARVGATAGSNMASWLRANGYNLLNEPSDPEHLALMLDGGRIDAALANPLTFERAFADIGARAERFATQAALNKPLGVYFTNTFLAASPGFLERFNTRADACHEALRPPA